ncbi:putative Solute carrier family 35 member G1 [Hypsibius exemplaris]|uniref:Solute carrier family 35 member G1 n=1 Tax=Hypsibius exemplaris TaxID=2072580 RepID=A0A1W0WGU1_HYPEX|nr:putative Solute carrier family 35 member G1 [Hypsibius exemplaris]
MPEHFPRVPTSEMLTANVDEPTPTLVLLKTSNTGRGPLNSLAASSNETLESSLLDDSSGKGSLDPFPSGEVTTAAGSKDEEDPEETKAFITVTFTPPKEEEVVVSVEEVKKPETVKGNCWRSSLGVLLGLTSGFTNSLVALLVKLIETIGTFEIAVFRYVVMLVPLIVTLGWKRNNPFRLELVKKSGWALVLRAVVGAASTYCKYFALRKLPLADASVILFSSPVFVSVMARIFLKEPFRWVHGGAIAVSLGGCILVSRPTFIFGSAAYNPTVEWDDHMWGCLSALASAIFSASVFVTVRHMKQVDSTVVLFWTAFVGLIISLVATAAADDFIFPTDLQEISYIIGVGVLTLISQEALTRALRLESAGLISLLRTGDIVWAFVWQIALFHVVPHYFSIIGAIMVVVCVMFVSLREATEKLPPGSRLRRAIQAINGATEDAGRCCRRKRRPLHHNEVPALIAVPEKVPTAV